MVAPDPASFRRAMGTVPTAVTVVTALGPDGPLGATANAVLSLSVDPPLMLAALDRKSRTLGAVQESRAFGINVLAADQSELALRFATKDPHPVKWDGVDWSELAGVPALNGATLTIACDLLNELDGGDHAVLTGAVTALTEREAEALIFHRGSYRPLGYSHGGAS